MRSITLSICIATRNRAGLLEQTLASIISQGNDEVEIVIVDGASTDKTEDVVSRYRKQYPRLHYLRETKNGGVDRDYSTSVELAKGTYCWLMSDDDILRPGAVKSVLEQTYHGYDLIVVNTESRNINLSRVLVKQHCPLKANRIYTSGDFQALFVDTARHLSFIGAVVIKRAVWLERNVESYFGSLFVHVGVIFQKPLLGNALVLADPLISVRRGNVSWGSRAFEIWLVKWPNLIWSFTHFSDEAKLKITKREPSSDLKVLLKFRGSCCYSISEYRRWLMHSQKSMWFKYAARLAAFFPISLLSPLLIAYLLLFESGSKGSVYELLRNPMFKQSLHFWG